MRGRSGKAARRGGPDRERPISASKRLLWLTHRPTGVHGESPTSSKSLVGTHFPATSPAGIELFGHHLRHLRQAPDFLLQVDANQKQAERPGVTGSTRHPLSCGGPGMGDDLEVKVLPEPGRRDRREAQGVRREAYAERSVKRTRESTNRNRIRGAADRGERTTDREAPATKGKRRRSGDCAGKVIVLTRGGLA